MLTFLEVKAAPLTERQLASIREQIRRFVSLFKDRGRAVRGALRKAHEFGWSNSTRGIPQDRYRNALMAVSMLRSSASHDAWCNETCRYFWGLEFVDEAGTPKEIASPRITELDVDQKIDDMIATVFDVGKQMPKQSHLRLVHSRD